ncbi:MAG: hypothetical protein KA275_03520 [Chitinophagaceae bacterium]|nr:hypothetical protein [Chitinophagaceae bacterium]
MKTIKLILIVMTVLNFPLFAQTSDSTKTKKNISIDISKNGIHIGEKTALDIKKKKKKHKKSRTSMHFDFGFNNFFDFTNYESNGVKLLTTNTIQGSALSKADMKLNTTRSINFNIWPVWFTQNLAKKNVQLITGVGFQFFNFRFGTSNTNYQFVKYDSKALPPTPSTEFFEPPYLIQFNREDIRKNKFGASYASIPLMLKFTPTPEEEKPLSFAVGIIGSYNLKNWTKVTSNQYGKQKEKGDFGVNNWMFQWTAEFGVEDIFKFYGTYSPQSIFEKSLNFQPFAIGIRL